MFIIVVLSASVVFAFMAGFIHAMVVAVREITLGGGVKYRPGGMSVGPTKIEDLKELYAVGRIDIQEFESQVWLRLLWEDQYA